MDEENCIEMTFDLVIPKRACSGVRVFIDQLKDTPPEEWTPTVRTFTKEWVTKTNYKNSASLWFLGRNEISPVDGRPAWVEHVAVGILGKSFAGYLMGKLQANWGSAVQRSYDLQVKQSDGWAILCHIEEGNVYQPVDPISWLLVE